MTRWVVLVCLVLAAAAHAADSPATDSPGADSPGADSPATDSPGADSVVLEWPDLGVKRELTAYIAESLLNIHQTDRRPTLEERLAAKPFVTGSGRVALDLTSLDPDSAKVLRDAAQTAGGGLALSQEAFFPPAEKLYLERRYFMGQISHLRKSLNMDTDTLWQHVDVLSVITRTKRRIWFHAGEVLISTVAALERGGPIVYRPGTWFLVDDLDDGGAIRETHVLGKRADWEWDFAIYDDHGVVAAQSPTLGAEMRVPTSCFKCHRASGRLPPFANFPGPSDEMNGYRPQVLVTLTAAEQEIVRALSGRKGTEADDAMGDYAGLSALALRRAMHDGSTQPDWVQKLWVKLVRLVPSLGN